MPTLPRPVTGVRLSRRAALTAVATLVGGAVVGCTSDRKAETPPEPAEPRVDPDVAVAAGALADQEGMLDLLAATRRRHRRLSGILAPAAAAHRAHAAVLSKAVPGRGSASPSASPSTPSDGSARRRTRVPRDRARALQRIVEAERELTTATKRHAFQAESGAFARLLASIAAAAAQNATMLDSAAGGGRTS